MCVVGEGGEGEGVETMSETIPEQKEVHLTKSKTQRPGLVSFRGRLAFSSSFLLRGTE